MTSFSKTALALLLLAGGFIAAKTFGPPDLAKRLVDSWRPEPTSGYGELRPAAMDKHQAEFLPPLEMMSPPTGFAATPPASAPATSPSGLPAAPAPTRWAAPPAPVDSIAAADAWSARAADPALRPSSFEEEMAPLRPTARAAAPHTWQTPEARPLASPAQRDANPSGPPTPTSGWSDGWGTPSAGPATAPPPAFPASEPPAEWAAPSSTPVREVSQTVGSSTFGFAPSAADGWAGSNEAAAPVTPLAPLAPPSPWDEGAGTTRTHIVTDGDSLPRLAERYLGDAKRSTEIYELNRAQLTHPELLPLGLELRLPR